MTTRAKCRALAEELGCDLEYRRNRWHGGGAQHVNITLPEGMQVVGNPGLDALHHECLLDENIWPGVYGDLQLLDGGMEPNEDTDEMSEPISATPDPRDARPESEMVGRDPIFRDHNCYRCRDGERPCVRGNPRSCDTLHARND